MTQLALGTPGSRNRPALRRRRAKSAVLVGLLVAAVVVAVGVLAWVLIYVAIQGVSALNLGFLTQTPPGNPAAAGGGFYNGIIGSLIIVGIAARSGSHSESAQPSTWSSMGVGDWPTPSVSSTMS